MATPSWRSRLDRHWRRSLATIALRLARAAQQRAVGRPDFLRIRSACQRRRAPF